MSELPNVEDIAGAKNLKQLSFDKSKSALEALRAGFKIKGFSRQEREITYALESTGRFADLKNGDWIEKIVALLRMGFVDYFTDFGLSALRPIGIVLSLIPVFFFAYVKALGAAPPAGIWKVGQMGANGKIKEDRLDLHGYWNARYALWFSVLSGFRLGTQYLNVQSLFTRIQSEEYTLRPEKWVRTVSGIQAAISAYLFLLAGLTFFGNLFQ